LSLLNICNIVASFNLPYFSKYNEISPQMPLGTKDGLKSHPKSIEDFLIYGLILGKLHTFHCQLNGIIYGEA
jgi:hypothetical protein